MSRKLKHQPIQTCFHTVCHASFICHGLKWQLEVGHIRKPEGEPCSLASQKKILHYEPHIMKVGFHWSLGQDDQDCYQRYWIKEDDAFQAMPNANEIKSQVVPVVLSCTIAIVHDLRQLNNSTKCWMYKSAKRQFRVRTFRAPSPLSPFIESLCCCISTTG